MAGIGRFVPRALNSHLGRGQRWQRLAIFVWATILVVLCIRGLLSSRRNSVYPIFATAARDFWAGANLYRSAEAPYRYSPLVAALFVPFSLWPDPIGGVLWRLLNAAVYLAALGWWCRTVLPRSLTASQKALLYLLIIPLSVGSLNNAQSNPLVLGLLLAGVSTVARGGWNLASAFLALACLFKLYPVAVGLLVAAVYPRRFAGRFLIALATGLALPFLLKPSAYVLEQYAGWWHHLVADDRQQLQIELWYRDLRLLCHVWHIPLGALAYLVIQLFAAAAIAAACTAGRLAHWQERRLLTLLFSLACCWMTLLGPATESATYILLAPTLAWSMIDALRSTVPWSIRTGLIGSFGLFLLTQTAVWFPGTGRQVHALGLQPLAALILVICLIAMQFQGDVGNGAAGVGSGVIRPAEAA
jgi:hypothetical protein